jgi:hypothetical protein
MNRNQIKYILNQDIGNDGKNIGWLFIDCYVPNREMNLICFINQP